MISTKFSATYYNYSYLLSHVQSTRKQLDIANFQVASGKRASSFTDQPMAATYVRLKSTIAQQTQYISNCTTAKIRLKIIDQVLAGIETVTNEARKAADVTEYNPEHYPFLWNFAVNSFDQVVDFLNTKTGNGSIFGGLSTDRRPVTVPSGPEHGAWSKLPALLSPPAAPNTPGSQAQGIIDAAADAAIVTGATPASVAAALPNGTPQDVRDAAAAAVTAAGASAASVAAAVETAVRANVSMTVSFPGVNPDDPGHYFALVEDPSTSPPTFIPVNAVAFGTDPDPAYAGYYYTGGPGVDRATGRSVDGLSIQLDDTSSVPMGFSARENAFEKILRGLHILSQIPHPTDPENPTDAERAAFAFHARAAQDLLRQGSSELDAIRLRASSAMTTVTDKSAMLSSLRNTTMDAVDPLENIDPATAAATVISLQNALSASYSVIAQLKQNTILNYL